MAVSALILNGTPVIDLRNDTVEAEYVLDGITGHGSDGEPFTGEIENGVATAPATISGTATSVVTGSNTLTLSAAVSVTPNVTVPGYIEEGTSGTSTVSLQAPSYVTTKGATTYTPGAANQTIAANTYLSGAQTILGDANLIPENIKDGVPIFGVTGEYQGGSASGMTVATATATPSTASASISFTGLSGEPTSFAVTTTANLATGASPYKTAAVIFDGTSLRGQIVTNTNNAQASYSTSFTKTYNNGTLTITGTGTNFQANQYKLVYTYGGNSANVKTAQTQVGSGATSVAFTGLTAEPDYFSVIFTDSFSTSSGYQRVMSVVHDGTNTYGVAMESGAVAASSWSYTYSNGTLTVASTSTTAGGYFHQPGYYQLTYGVGGTVEPTQIEVEPLNATTNGTYTAPTGKAYSPVTVNVASGGVQTDTKTVTASNYPVSLDFTGMKGEPKMFTVRLNAAVSSSGSTTYYYIVNITSHGSTSVHGNVFRIGSTRQVNSITSGYSWSYSGTTLTITSSAASRSASPGAFYSGSYELFYVY